MLGLTILFLIYKAIVPFGEITYNIKPCEKSFFISVLKPADRINGECSNIITGDPVYFNLNTPRTFDSGEVSITYKTNQNLNIPIIELGVLADAQKNYKLKPLENKIISTLNEPISGWDSMLENGITLWQRGKFYESIGQFLDNLNDIPRDKILTYYYDLPAVNVIPNYGNYLASSKTFPSDSIPALRGSYQFYTYLENEDLDFIFKFVEINKNNDDKGKIEVYYKNNLVKQRDVLTGGSIELTMENRPTGFYKIAVSASDNIITENIKSPARIISFINKINLAKTLEPELIDITTDSREIFARTIHPNSLQKILIGDEILKITETYKQFSALTNAPISNIKLAKDGVEIAGDGLFSFTSEAFYNPDYRKMDKNTDINTDEIDYIITTYDKGQSTDNWQTRTITFDLKNSFRYENAYGFLISIPGLLADDDVDDFIEIGEIEIKLKGRSIIAKIKEVLNF